MYKSNTYKEADIEISISLIALGVGYKVCLDASKESGRLKTYGRAIGLFIIIVSLAGVLCGAYFKACGAPLYFKHFCPITALGQK